MSATSVAKNSLGPCQKLCTKSSWCRHSMGIRWLLGFVWGSKEIKEKGDKSGLSATFLSTSYRRTFSWSWLLWWNSRYESSCCTTMCVPRRLWRLAVTENHTMLCAQTYRTQLGLIISRSTYLWAVTESHRIRFWRGIAGACGIMV